MNNKFPPNMQALMKQAMKMQQDLQKAEEKSGDLTAEASAGGGMLKIVANGRGQLLSVLIDPEVLKSGDAEMLQDLFKAAANDALSQAQEKRRQEVSKVTGGMPIPGLG